MNRFLNYKVLYLFACVISLFYSFGYGSLLKISEIINAGGVFNSISGYHMAASISFLNGYLFLPLNPISHLDNDLQLYNGGVFTQWGLGIPLLQLPFHFFYQFFFNKNSTFPDVLIFIFYYLLTCSLLFDFINKKFKKNNLITFYFSYLIISITILWITSYRFLIYEETAAYFILFSINSFIFFIYYIDNSNIRNTFWLCVNLILMLSIRQTALPLIFLIIFYKILYSKRVDYYYVIFITILLALYAYVNYLKTGTLFSTGVSNSNPGDKDELLFIRTSLPCLNYDFQSLAHRFVEFFKAIFIGSNIGKFYDGNCYLRFEDSLGLKKPYISYLISAQLILFILLYYDNFKNILFPLIGFLIIFVLFSVLANGYAYRYIVDFFFYIFFISYFIILKIKDKKYILLIFPISLYLLFQVFYIVNIQKNTVRFNFNKENTSNYSWKFNDIYPIIRLCGDIKKNEYDGYGWGNDCFVNSYVNTYLSVDPKLDREKLFLKIEGDNIPSHLNFIFNGKKYRNFDPIRDTLKIDIHTISNNFNLFLYFNPDDKVKIESISLK